MTIFRLLLPLLAAFASTLAFGATPALESPLPVLSISDQGELTYTNDDFGFAPWRSDTNPGKVHVIQYFGATQSASDTFKPFTDLLQTALEPDTVHVSTVINLDAAMWGTGGFVMSELKKNKKVHPLATMVVDKKGSGVSAWGLGDKGIGLAILDKQGTVKFFSTTALTPEQMDTAIALVKSLDAS